MGRRVASFAWLMVLVLGFVVAAQSPSPEATPLHAPDDIGSAVPNRVGSLELYVRVAGPDTSVLGSDPEDRAYWTDFLAARGKEPSDMVAAYGVDLTSGTDPALEVWAIRVTGLDAASMAGAPSS